MTNRFENLMYRYDGMDVCLLGFSTTTIALGNPSLGAIELESPHTVEISRDNGSTWEEISVSKLLSQH